VPAACPSGGATADSRGLSRTTCQQTRRSANPQVTAMQRHRLPKLTVQALVRSGFRSWYAGGSVGVLPRTRRRIHQITAYPQVSGALAHLRRGPLVRQGRIKNQPHSMSGRAALSCPDGGVLAQV
jgi:hypothetical protein